MTVTTELGKITACKEVLNRISMAFDEAAEENKAKGYISFFEQLSLAGSQIYDALNAEGYYDCVRDN